MILIVTMAFSTAAFAGARTGQCEQEAERAALDTYKSQALWDTTNDRIETSLFRTDVKGSPVGYEVRISDHTDNGGTQKAVYDVGLEVVQGRCRVRSIQRFPPNECPPPKKWDCWDTANGGYGGEQCGCTDAYH